jgi:hypothetical protein
MSSLLCALIYAVGLMTPSSSLAYRFHAVKWPAGIVPYFNAAPDQESAVAEAVQAWRERRPNPVCRCATDRRPAGDR